MSEMKDLNDPLLPNVSRLGFVASWALVSLLRHNARGRCSVAKELTPVVHPPTKQRQMTFSWMTDSDPTACFRC